MMKERDYSGYVFAAVFILIAYVSYLIIKPFLAVIIGAMVIAYLSYPVYSWLLKRSGRKYLSATLTILMIILVISIPIALVITTLVSEAGSMADHLRNSILAQGIDPLDCDEGSGAICSIVDAIDGMFPSLGLKDDLSGYVKDGIDEMRKLLRKSADIFSSIVTSAINFFMMIFLAFYLLVDGKRLLETLKKLMCLEKKKETRILDTMKDTVHAVVFGQIIIALIQGGVAAIGYWLIGGFENPVLWGFITAIFAIIPYFGTAIIWLPASLLMLLDGIASDEIGLIIRAIILFAYGVLVISSIDNIIKPKIVGDKANVHPAFILLGVLGGLALMGAIGLIVGPVIIAVLLTLVRLYEADLDDISYGISSKPGADKAGIKKAAGLADSHRRYELTETGVHKDKKISGDTDRAGRIRIADADRKAGKKEDPDRL